MQCSQFFQLRRCTRLILFWLMLITAPFFMMLPTTCMDFKGSRILSASSDSKESEKTTTNIYLIMILVAVIVLLVGGLICCLICTVRHFLQIRQHHGLARVANISVSFEFIFPPIHYETFAIAVGKPVQDNCVICLEEFAASAFSDQSDLVFEPEQFKKIPQDCEPAKEDKKSIESKVGNSQKNEGHIVKFTMCGHLLHGHCLDQWLERQENCPLCRQSFAEENISSWELKLSMNFEHQYEKYLSCSKKNQKKKNAASSQQLGNRRRNRVLKSQDRVIESHQATLSELAARVHERGESFNEQINSQSRQAEVNSDKKGSVQEEYAITIYSIIMHYHKTHMNFFEGRQNNAADSTNGKMLQNSEQMPHRRGKPFDELEQIGNSVVTCPKVEIN